MQFESKSTPCIIPLDSGEINPDAVLLFSGGIDSTVLLYDLIDQGLTPLCLGFDYGQRHAGNEFNAAREITRAVGLPFVSTQLDRIPCGLTSGGDLVNPVVPGRNAIFMSHAASVAGSIDVHKVYIGINATDRLMFPDCRPYFLLNLYRAFSTAYDVEILAPYSNLTKSEIGERGRDLGAPLDLTWSCYMGRAEQCGTCSACIERAVAIGT